MGWEFREGLFGRFSCRILFDHSLRVARLRPPDDWSGMRQWNGWWSMLAVKWCDVE